jgi:hypothetical protein
MPQRSAAFLEQTEKMPYPSFRISETFHNKLAENIDHKKPDLS